LSTALSKWLDRPMAAGNWVPEMVRVAGGFTLDRAVAEAASVAVQPHLERLRAWREGKVFAFDGHHLFNRPGPRLIDSLKAFAEMIIHPGRFTFAATRRFGKPLTTAP